MRKLISFIIILLLFTFAGIAKAGISIPTSAGNLQYDPPQITACTVKFVNNTNKTYVFWLSWIDHPFLYQTEGKPWHKVMAEIGPEKSFTPESKQAPGLYIVKCREAWIHGASIISKDLIIAAKNKTIIIALFTDTHKRTALLIFKYDT